MISLGNPPHQVGINHPDCYKETVHFGSDRATVKRGVIVNLTMMLTGKVPDERPERVETVVTPDATKVRKTEMALSHQSHQNLLEAQIVVTQLLGEVGHHLELTHHLQIDRAEIICEGNVTKVKLAPKVDTIHCVISSQKVTAALVKTVITCIPKVKKRGQPLLLQIRNQRNPRKRKKDARSHPRVQLPQEVSDHQRVLHADLREDLEDHKGPRDRRDHNDLEDQGGDQIPKASLSLRVPKDLNPKLKHMDF